MSFSKLHFASIAGFVLVAGTTGLGGCAAPSAADESTELTAASSAAVTVAACGKRHVNPTEGADAMSNGTANDCRSRRSPCRTAQHAIAVACSGDLVALGAGDYTEDLIIDRPLTLAGSGARTVLRPATSHPDPCDDSSLCGGAATSVVLVRSSDVTIHDLAIDGDNPALTSGVVRGGSDIDARNGIVVDFDAGRFDALEVYDVHVRNAFARGIYASSGGTFNFHDDRVSNVAGGPGSVAILNFGGSGMMARNHVEKSLDGIVSNHSSGVVMLHNRVNGSGSGLHTDNAGDTAGSSADLIAGNVVENCTPGGFGVWAFVPYVGPTLRDNRVEGCDVGLAAFGQGAAVTTTFVDNRVDGERHAGSTGVLVTTDQLGFGSNNTSVLLSRNVIVHNDVGIRLTEQPGFVNTTTIECNRIEHNGTGIVTETIHSQAHHDAIVANRVGVDASALASGSFDATRNYWGCHAGPPDPRCDGFQGSVDASSALSRPPPCAHGERCGHFALDEL